VYAEILIGVSLAVAAYQDVKERAVSDLVWIPALVGAAYSLYALYPDLGFPGVKFLLVGGIALGFAFFGLVGQADAIAIAFVALDPYVLSPIAPLFAAAFFAIGHFGYEFAVGNARGGKSIPMEQFVREQRWIPKAVVKDGVRKEVSADVNVAREEAAVPENEGSMVEVSYGVPTVAYLGLGYLTFLAYIVAFMPATFTSLP